MQLLYFKTGKFNVVRYIKPFMLQMLQINCVMAQWIFLFPLYFIITMFFKTFHTTHVHNWHGVSFHVSPLFLLPQSIHVGQHSPSNVTWDEHEPRSGQSTYRQFTLPLLQKHKSHLLLGGLNSSPFLTCTPS